MLPPFDTSMILDALSSSESRRHAFRSGFGTGSLMNVRARVERQSSITEPDIESILKVGNYCDTVNQLDMYYGLVKRQLLRHQSPTTGLFPAQAHNKKVGSVRDSIYCAAAVWALYQAYRRIDDDRGKSYELGQSAVKCIRGILSCWFRETSKVENFKSSQRVEYALHTYFDLATGAELSSEEFTFKEGKNNLQIDVISLFLVFLVQMITSGLQIIYTSDEIFFIQNLVYYVERAYRTPDFGMWARGSKYNEGKPEIHASSIGMAKAALEAINGCNLFGDRGCANSVIYVDIDAHNRNRSIFETMLPKESSSKNTDSSLLPALSWPCFATHDEMSYNQTKAKIVKKLKGNYGFKRFLRDGYGTILEDKDREFYTEGETKNFEQIESEWPIFYLFMIIDGVFKGLPDQVLEYQKLLKPRLKRDHLGDPIVPKYFFVPEDSVEYERQDPGSQFRQSSSEGSPSDIFLWGQAMYVIADLLTEGLVHINEIDLIRRYLPSYNRPRRGGRYSAFQGTASDLVVQVVLIAESMRLQAMMATYGIQTQTPHEVEPVQIWPPGELVKVYQNLGVSESFNLTGRPGRPIGALGTSKVYRICGQTILCYPLIFEVSEFYLSHDMSLLIDDIKTELQFVGRYWRLSGRPTVCILIREEHMRDPQFKEMIDLFALLRNGSLEGLKVRTGRLQNLISSSCIEHLDFVSDEDFERLNVQPFTQLKHEYIGYQSLTDVPTALKYTEEDTDFSSFVDKSTYDILEALKLTTTFKGQAELLAILIRREGMHYQIENKSLRDRMIDVKRRAGSVRIWSVVRYCSSILEQLVDSISPFITTVLVNGKLLTVGVIGKEEIVLDKPMTPKEIQLVLYKHVAPYDLMQAVLQQEVLLYCGRLIATNPELFSGILKIRIGWVLKAVELYLTMTNDEELKMNGNTNGSPSQDSLNERSPSELRRLIYKVLTVKEWASDEKLSPLHRRQLEGALSRVPDGFYPKVWLVLSKTLEGINLQGHKIDKKATTTNMTLSELNFRLTVEDMLSKCVNSEYRQIIVELLCILATILERNPELQFRCQVDLDQLISDALQIFLKDTGFGRKNSLDVTKKQSSDESQLFETHILLFCSAPPSLTNGLLARAVVNNLLKGGVQEDAIENDFAERCQIS
ncbi:probable phosphorylase b kinase regulatory subunit beta isoform X2 [Artemia franciscana]